MLKSNAPFAVMNNRTARGLFDLWMRQELGEEISDCDESCIPQMMLLLGAKPALRNNQKIITKLLLLYSDVAESLASSPENGEAKNHLSLLANGLLHCVSEEKMIIFPDNAYWEKAGKKYSGKRYEHLLCLWARDENLSAPVRIQAMRFLDQTGNGYSNAYNWQRLLGKDCAEIENAQNDLSFLSEVINQQTESNLLRNDPRGSINEGLLEIARSGLAGKIALLQKLSPETTLWPALVCNLYSDYLYSFRFNRHHPIADHILEEISREQNKQPWQELYTAVFNPEVSGKNQKNSKEILTAQKTVFDSLNSLIQTDLKESHWSNDAYQKRQKWLLELLQYPLQYSAGNALQSDAVATSFRLIKSKISTLPEQADCIKETAALVTDSKISHWLGEEADLLNQKDRFLKVTTSYAETMQNIIYQNNPVAQIETAMQEMQLATADYAGYQTQADEHYKATPKILKIT